MVGPCSNPGCRREVEGLPPSPSLPGQRCASSQLQLLLVLEDALSSLTIISQGGVLGRVSQKHREIGGLVRLCFLHTYTLGNAEGGWVRGQVQQGCEGAEYVGHTRECSQSEPRDISPPSTICPLPRATHGTPLAVACAGNTGLQGQLFGK